ncbi:MAG: hypothetical protein O2962_02995, partial [Cyanobacteria bacterium]|nr:hypothetical protein [Cyanobacteriota bacterium]
NQLPVTIAAYPVNSSYLARSTVFEATQMNTVLNGATSAKDILENINQQLKEAGAFENVNVVKPVMGEGVKDAASRKLGEWFAKQSA